MNKWEQIEKGWHVLNDERDRSLAGVVLERDMHWHCYLNPSSKSAARFRTLKKAKAFVEEKVKEAK